MDSKLYVKLSDQIARQTSELAAYDAQIASAQPAIDSAQAWLTTCTSSLESAKAERAALPEGADPAADALITTRQQTADTASADLAALTSQQNDLIARANAVRAAIAQCQSALDAGGLVMTSGDIAAQVLQSAVSIAIRKIDADVDAIYKDVIGNRGPEYTLAETEAMIYKAPGYAGSVPPSVASWASAKSWTANQAADDIIAAASAWRSAQTAIRSNRLAIKEQVRGAANTGAVASSMAAWGGFVAAIRSALGA